MRKAFLVIVLSLPFVLIEAQIELRTELRLRPELDYRTDKLFGEERDLRWNFGMRTRAGLCYRGERISSSASLQQTSFIAGEVSNSDSRSHSNSLIFKEAWIRLKLFDYSYLKVGRQFLKYDNQRLLAWRNWNNNALSYDILLYQYDNENFKADVGVSWNEANTFRIKNSWTNMIPLDKYWIRSFNFIYLSKPVESSKLSWFFINTVYKSSVSSSKYIFKYTTGPYVYIEKENLHLQSELYGQFGQNINEVAVRSYFYSVKGLYKVGKLVPSLALDWFSGTNLGQSNIIDNSFDNLYGARYKFTGYMNQFSNLRSSTLGSGLINPYACLRFNISDANAIEIFYHRFYLQHEVLNNGNLLDKKYLGSEVDLSFNWQCTETLQLTYGASLFSPTQTLESIRLGIDPTKQPKSSNYWFYLMISFNPTHIF